MDRAIIPFLIEWLNNEDRLPLVLRGARQVGKTWVVRELAKQTNKRLIEFNFEKHPQHKTLFNSNDIKQVILNIESLKEIVVDSQAILFFDEIQAAPELLSKLRWFAEDIPDLAVVAAGSLLEFTLAKYQYSMPVGRITYAHLEPLSFEEFLTAYNKCKLVTYINNVSLQTTIPEALHLQLLQLFKEYIIIGGLPKAVDSWIQNKSLEKANKIHHDLLSTYKDDFAKYQGKLSLDYLHDTLQAVPNMLGDKFIYKRVNPNAQSAPLRQAVNLLNQARICHSVKSTSANGLPLGAGINKRYFKEIFIDIGLASAQLGLSLHNLSELKDINFVNKGGLSEQVVGQLLRTNQPYYIEPALYYWSKENASSNAELDYIIQHETKIIPIEVKSGATGTLKSLHVFMDLKQLKIAVRINSTPPSFSSVQSKLHDGRKVSYELLSIPFYLIGQLDRLLKTI